MSIRSRICLLHSLMHDVLFHAQCPRLIACHGRDHDRGRDRGRRNFAPCVDKHGRSPFDSTSHFFYAAGLRCLGMASSDGITRSHLILSDYCSYYHASYVNAVLQITPDRGGMLMLDRYHPGYPCNINTVINISFHSVKASINFSTLSILSSDVWRAFINITVLSASNSYVGA